MIKNTPSPWAEIKLSIAGSIAKILKMKVDEVISTLEEPTESKMGDLASTVSFVLAKKYKKAPIQVANEILPEMTKIPFVKECKVGGAGYLNYFLSWSDITRLVLKSVMKSGLNYGQNDIGKGSKVVVESPAVTPSKPWHIGHARNAVLGDTLSRLLQILGFKVERMDYINDMGMQTAQLAWYLPQSQPWDKKEKYDHYLGRMYVEVTKLLEQDEEKLLEVRQFLKSMEMGGSREAIQARRMSEKCVQAFRKTGYRLNITHDLEIWESDVTWIGLFQDAISLMLKYPGIERLDAGEKAGCIVAKMDKFEEFRKLRDSNKVLVRSDGTGTYTGKDIAFQLWKFGIIADPFKYRKVGKQPDDTILWMTAPDGQAIKRSKPESVFNVIAVEQAHPQRLIYLILELMGYQQQSQNSHHISYEIVTLPDVSFSGRKGTWLGYTADDVLDEAISRARKEVDMRHPESEEEVKSQIAEAIGVGAVRFALLKQAPEKRIVFVWDQVLDFNGQAAPYVQYAYVRASRILEKAGKPSKAHTIDYSLLNTEYEKQIIKQVAKYPEILSDIVHNMHKELWGTKINLYNLPQYAYDLSVTFSQFYSNCPVLRADEELRFARLALVSITRQTLFNVLYLMGIKPPPIM